MTDDVTKLLDEIQRARSSADVPRLVAAVRAALHPDMGDPVFDPEGVAGPMFAHLMGAVRRSVASALRRPEKYVPERGKR